MATYAVGDIQGRYNDLLRLLDRLEFSFEKDRLILLGDLVNRGPDSLGVIRFAMQHPEQVRVILGNHDLFLIGILENILKQRPHDTLSGILTAPDRKEIHDWLCKQPLAIHDPELNFLAVHAGVHPQWTLEDALERAQEVEQVLKDPIRTEFFKNMRGNKPKRWSDSLEGWERIRVIVNVLTRMRYIKRNKKLDFKEMGPRGKQKKKLVPWFDFPNRVRIEPTIVFGHWSSLGVYMKPGLLALDSGCCWGGSLSAARLDRQSYEIFQVPCDRGNPKG